MDIEIVRKKFESRGCVLLSTECPTFNSTLKYICECERESEVKQHVFLTRQNPCPKCRLGKISDVKKIFTDQGCIPKFNNFDSYRQKLEYICKCGKDVNKSGEPLTTTYEKIVNGITCQWCGDKKKAFSFDDVKKYFEQEKCILISTEYKNCIASLQYYCSCGNKEICKTNFNRFKEGHRCKRCGNMRADLKTAKERMLQKKCKLLTTSENYENDTLNYICHCGRERSVSYKQFMRNSDIWSGCKECFVGTQRKDYDDVFDLFESKGVFLLETEYQHRHQKMLCICSCGQFAEMCVADISRGRLCIGCASDRRKKTNNEVYNTDNPFQNEICKEKARQTMLKRYGYEHNLQNPEILTKAIHANFRRKEFTFPSGNVVHVQGYEPFALQYLIDINYKEEDIITNCLEMPEFYYNCPITNVIRRYYPDIYIPKDNIILEVKSDYTYNLHKDINIEKFKTVKNSNYNIHIHIYDKKGNQLINWKNMWE